jgi:hypothetical protein
MIPVEVFKVLLGLTVPFYVISIFLYFRRRRNFPIAQRYPVLCVLELILYAGISFSEGNNSLTSNNASSASSILKNCTWASIMFTIAINFGLMLTACRLCFLMSKDFTTKILLLESDNLGLNKTEKQKELIDLYSANNPCFKMSYWITVQMLKRTSLSVIVGLIMLPGALIGLVNSISVIVRTSNLDPDLPNYVDECFNQSWHGMGRLQLAMFLYFGFIALIGVSASFKMKDNFHLGTEVRMLLVYNVYLCTLTTLVMWDIDLFKRFIVDEPLFHLLQLLISFPFAFLIQCIYPLWLSYRHQALHMSFIAPKTVSGESTVGGGTVKVPDLSTAELEFLISDSEGRDILLKFLEAEYAVENLFFIETCDKFQRDLNKYLTAPSFDEKHFNECVEYLRKIKDTFVVVSAVNCVNISFP